MQLYYVERIESGILSPAESHHCIRTMRTNAGESIYATDGRGLLAELLIVDPDPRACAFKMVSSKRIPATKHHIHMAIAPTKQADRTEWFVEKATEIGVHELSFFFSEHSERKRINLPRIEKKVISAAKQAVRVHFPGINDPVPLDGILTRIREGERFIAHNDGQPGKLQAIASPGACYTVLVGPEGGFSSNELERARSEGFREVSLGSHRLRTETAGIVACQILTGING